MSIADLAELARRRGIRRIIYFHTDHFEPWSLGVTDQSVRALERFRELSRRSPYGSHLSLFYLTNNAHSLTDARDEGHVGLPGEQVAFFSHERNAPKVRQRMIDAIRPLVTEDHHEFHLHVHHERWTRNSLQTDSPIWKWVQEHSTPERDEDRFSLFVKLALDTIAKEIGHPLQQWAFVHGNWALSGSDDEICRIESEIELLMKAGAYGDFTFPAGRPHCDPSIEQPFTCLPVRCAKSYNAPEAQPTAVGFGTHTMTAERFFIWNSVLKADDSSIDWYYTPNLVKLRNLDRIVQSWLQKGVLFGDTLFFKTHSHSMNYRYELWRDDTPIPHTHPDVVGAFEHLMRVCDQERIEFRVHTANEVVSVLRAIDAADSDHSKAIDDALFAVAQARRHVAPAGAGTESSGEALALTKSERSIEDLGIEFADNLRTWINDVPERRARIGDYYENILFRNPKSGLQGYEQTLIHYACAQLDPAKVKLFELGPGFGLMASVLAERGYEVVAFEQDSLRSQGLDYLARRIRERRGSKPGSVHVVSGSFPESLDWNALQGDSENVLILTNVVNSAVANRQEAILRVASAFDHVVIHLGLFGRPRHTPEEISRLFGALEQRFDAVARLDGDSAGLVHFKSRSPLAPVPPARDRDVVFATPDDIKDRVRMVTAARRELKHNGSEPDDFYTAKLNADRFIELHEEAIAHNLLRRFPERGARIMEIGTGQGGLSCLLGALGFEVMTFEMNATRLAVAEQLVQRLSGSNAFRQPILVKGAFPDTLDGRALLHPGRTVVVATNVVNSYTAENQARILRAVLSFDELILDLGRFGINRDGPGERRDLLERLRARQFEAQERVYHNPPQDYWRFTTRPFAVS